MPESQHGIPSKGGGGVVIAAILMLLLAGGLVFWKMNSGDPEPEVEEIKTPVVEKKEEPAPILDNAPPPPPSEEEIAEEEKQQAATNTGTVKTPSGPAGCSGTCQGSAGSALRSALATRGASAKSCYNTALRRNANLQGKMTVQVRLSPSGSVCSASVVNDTMGDGSVTACVLAKFRSAPFPKPDGGCVDTAVPLNFTSNQ